MADLTADDVIKRLSEMATRRSEFEQVWRQVSDVAAPDAPEFRFGSYASVESLGIHRAVAARRAQKIYDGTAAWAVDRLASGLEGLIMSPSELWHTLTIEDPYSLRQQTTDEETEWLESVRDFLFQARYDAGSGWQSAVQVALRRLVAFGNGLLIVEDGVGASLIRYRYLPIHECYLAEDQYGNIDTVYRVYMLTTRQALQKFGERCPAHIKGHEKSQPEKQWQFVQAICPRSDFGRPDEGVLRAPWGSYHFDFQSKQLVAESGYFEFPVIDFRWLPEPGRVYGEGPIMRVLPDVQSMQLMAKTEMIASQQAVRPPLLVRRNGVINRPDTNPGATILGGVDEQGRPAVQPLNLGNRIDFAQAVIQLKRENLRESLYINLFATMRDDPRQSATEALIKANEKGELLGPAGSRIQESLSRLVQRELGILERAGMFNRGSVFEPPRSLQGKRVGPKFTSQLDRLRHAKEAEGAVRTLEIINPLASVDPTVFDHIDKDEFVRGVAGTLGMPRKWLLRREEIQELRDARAQQQQMQQNLLMAQQAASAAKDAVPAMKELMAPQGA